MWNKFFKSMEDRHRQRHIRVAQLIGNYYLDKHNGSYVKAGDEALNLGVTNIEVMGNKITIKLMRPGILIGLRGTNIDSLTAYLSLHLDQNVKINIIEDRIIPHLIPYDALDNEYDNL